MRTTTLVVTLILLLTLEARSQTIIKLIPGQSEIDYLLSEKGGEREIDQTITVKVEFAGNPATDQQIPFIILNSTSRAAAMNPAIIHFVDGDIIKKEEFKNEASQKDIKLKIRLTASQKIHYNEQFDISLNGAPAGASFHRVVVRPKSFLKSSATAGDETKTEKPAQQTVSDLTKKEKWEPFFDTTLTCEKQNFEIFILHKEDKYMLRSCSLSKLGEHNICDTAVWVNNSSSVTFCETLASTLKTLHAACAADMVSPDCNTLHIAIKKKLEEIKKKDSVTANTEKQKNDYNKYLEGVEDVLFKNKLIPDTATANLKVKMINIPLYFRDFSQVSTNKTGRKLERNLRKKYVDPIGDVTQTYRYYPSNEKLKIDTLSLRVEDGYLASLTLGIDSSIAARLELNKITTIRRYLDLRSGREASENLNSYFPLESTRRFYRKSRLSTSKASEPAKFIEYSRYFINLRDIIDYYPQIDSSSDVLLHVKDRNFSFGPSGPKSVKLTDKDLSSFAQLNLYTDLVGLSEDKPNGLIQAEGKFQTGIFSQPLFNGKYYSKFRFRLLSAAALNVSITKIENKLKYFSVPRDSIYLFNRDKGQYEDTAAKNQKRINSIHLLQYSNLNVTATFNLIDFQSDYATFILKGGIGIVRTPINDTTTVALNSTTPVSYLLKEDKTIINSLKIFWGFLFKLKSTSKLGLDIGLDFQRLRLNHGSLIQSYGYYDYTTRKQIFKEAKLNNSKLNYFDMQLISPIMCIYYNIDRDQQKRFYLRAQYTSDGRSRTDDFFSLQLGYSTDLKGFFDQFKKK